jgi:long-chain fatty acid transport protein
VTGTVAFGGLLGPLGALNGTAPASARFSTPWLVVVGGRYRLTDRLTLDAQMQRVGWSRFQAIYIATPLGLSVQFQGYHDTSTGAVGLDYQVSRRLTVRGGVAYDPTPTPDVGRTARVPDGDRWLFGLGATVRPARRLELDTALAYVHLARSPIVSDATAYSGTPLVTPISYLGQASGEAVIVSAGARMRF